MFGWFRRGATVVVQKAKDLASESESEACRCVAHLVRWEGDQGDHVLSDGICKGSGVDVCLLEEDIPSGVGHVTLCPNHVN